MELGPIPDHLKGAMRKHFLSSLKNNRSLATYELDLFGWFRNETEKAWAQMDAEEQKYIQEQLTSGVDEINDSGVIATSYYLKRMRYSHVIFLASLLESAMKRECDRLISALNQEILFKPSELKGDPWSARKVFLERHGSFQIPNELWESIKALLNVRNAVVHHNGEVSLLTNEQAHSLRKVPGVEVYGSEVSVGASYLDLATEAVRNLMDFIHEGINSVIDRAVTRGSSGNSV